MLFNAKNPHGGDLYSQPIRLDYSANINPYGTPEAVKQAICDAARLVSHYPDPYCRELVGAIADFEGVPKEYILCGNGAAELIFAYCAAVHPKKALVLAPTFSEYETALTALGCQVEHYSLQRENGFQLTDGFLQTLCRAQVDLVMLCNPNNPTGQVIVPELLEQIRQLCREKQIRLFVDECFLDLTDGGESLSLKPKLAADDNIFLLKAFTKSYGMAGVRLGYCLCSNASVLEAMGKAVQPWNVSIPAQMAGIAALRQQDFLEKAKLTIRQERQYLTSSLSRLGLEVIDSKVNYILFYSRRELKAPLLEKGIQIRSCANYPGLCDGWYRIAVKLREENEQLICAMEEILNG